MKTKWEAFTYLAGIPFLIIVSLLPAATLWADTLEEVAPSAPSTAVLQATYGKLPLSFEANHGQWDPSVQFVTRGHGHTVFLTPNEVVLALRTGAAKAERGADGITAQRPPTSPPALSQSVVRMKFNGADPQAEVVGLEQLPGIVNYFIGADPSKWRTHIPTYQKVGYKDLYPGIDLVYYGNQGQLEYDLIVAPGADPNQITLAFDGAERITVDEQGDLVLTLPHSSMKPASETAPTLRLHKPVVYQKDEQGEKHLLSGTYMLVASQQSSDRSTSVVLHPNETQQVAFQIASYDTNRPLIIDPVLSWATYLGGSAGDDGSGIAADGAGQTYVTGSTRSTDFPTATPLQATLGGPQDAFVTKLSAAGTSLLYSTYLGGSNDEVGFGIAVDGASQAYVTGSTRSTDFPTATPLQAINAGRADVFVTKLSTSGAILLYSTYLGGSGGDVGRSIAVDRAGQAYVTGGTFSSNFPTAAPLQAALAGVRDAFVTKLNAAGTSLLYSTYLGGSGGDVGRSIAVDGAGQAYVTGQTGSANFPTATPLQATLAGGEDAFVAKITSASIVNDLVTFVPLASTYRTTADPTGCPSGFVGKFSFDARLTNKTSSPPLSDLAVQVKTLSNGNLLQNADGGNGGVGSILTVLKQHGYADGTLSRGESVDVHFSICLKVKKPFSFFVDVLGMRQE